ncbi:hypothetical protein MHL31_00335 [Lutibacter sp. A80]|uniref:hypothetical protein n=1 Tax=Lutibacter sp. A80 TaxID=2918453 RepID=UPI001F06E1B1|nr:hypothetical protein [Lutibacter sp. A80]UMB60675.1 hypothetical protein MHL31_00335 [Lutibacter sp. A80]
MKIQTKQIIKSGLLAGFIYALLMAGYDYSIGQDFRLLKFTINFIFFGFFIGILALYNAKKTNK